MSATYHYSLAISQAHLFRLASLHRGFHLITGVAALAVSLYGLECDGIVEA